MRVEDEIEPRDRIAQELHAQIGRRVDQKIFSVGFDLHRLPQTLIARVGRRADGAAAANDGNAG
jgi:signal transduction histidine kinase